MEGRGGSVSLIPPGYANQVDVDRVNPGPRKLLPDPGQELYFPSQPLYFLPRFTVVSACNPVRMTIFGTVNHTPSPEFPEFPTVMVSTRRADGLPVVVLTVCDNDNRSSTEWLILDDNAKRFANLISSAADGSPIVGRVPLFRNGLPALTVRTRELSPTLHLVIIEDDGQHATMLPHAAHRLARLIGRAIDHRGR
jgi:hypothetical protein